MRALSALGVALSLIAFNAVEGAHDHAESEASATCALCSVGHQSATTDPAKAPRFVEPPVLLAPALAGHSLTSGPLLPSSHRSRAPPPPISH